jgi:hypothetical protein
MSSHTKKVFGFGIAMVAILSLVNTGAIIQMSSVSSDQSAQVLRHRTVSKLSPRSNTSDSSLSITDLQNTCNTSQGVDSGRWAHIVSPSNYQQFSPGDTMNIRVVICDIIGTDADREYGLFIRNVETNTVQHLIPYTTNVNTLSLGSISNQYAPLKIWQIPNINVGSTGFYQIEYHLHVDTIGDPNNPSWNGTSATTNYSVGEGSANVVGTCNMEVLYPHSTTGLTAGSVSNVLIKVDHGSSADCLWNVGEGEAGDVSSETIPNFEVSILSALSNTWFFDALNGLSTYWVTEIQIPSQTTAGNYSLLFTDNNQADFPEGVTSQFTLPIVVQ